MPPQIREQMIRLGAENKRLKEQYDREMAHVNESKDEMNETIKKLMEEKNQLNERISQLEQVILCRFGKKFCTSKRQNVENIWFVELYKF